MIVASTIASTDLETVLLKILVDLNTAQVVCHAGTCTPSFHPAPATQIDANKARMARESYNASSTAGRLNHAENEYAVAPIQPAGGLHLAVSDRTA